jgi:hypothetical protein
LVIERTGIAASAAASFIESPPLGLMLRKTRAFVEATPNRKRLRQFRYKPHNLRTDARESGKHWRGLVTDPEMKARLDVPYMLRVAKLMVDPLRIKILTELNIREMSPKSFYEEFGGGSISRVSRAFDLLAEFGWLVQTRTETGGKRRGAVEHFYRATEPVVFYDEVWGPLPQSMKELLSAGVFEEISQRVREAIEAGTIDAREDRHFSWAPLRLDQQGWENVIAKVDALFHFLFEEQREANDRMAETDEEPVPATVVLAAFESPKDTTKAP